MTRNAATALGGRRATWAPTAAQRLGRRRRPGRRSGARLGVSVRSRRPGPAGARGIWRTLFYRWRTRFERYGPDGLHPRRHQARRGRPRQLTLPRERRILGVALAWPTWGCGRIAAHLARECATPVAPATVQRLLRRSGLPRRRDRLGLLEHHSAGTCGLLTERTRRQLARARGARSRLLSFAKTSSA